MSVNSRYILIVGLYFLSLIIIITLLDYSLLSYFAILYLFEAISANQIFNEKNVDRKYKILFRNMRFSALVVIGVLGVTKYYNMMSIAGYLLSLLAIFVACLGLYKIQNFFTKEAKG